MSIQVNNLAKRYEQQMAVDHVSFSINKGEIVGFLGPNGAGKSTTMKMICGFVEPTLGNIEVCQINPANQPELAKSKIGYLPESNPLYYDMYVKEYLHFVAGIYALKNPKQRVAEMITKTGLVKEQHKKIGQLSKGYKQRVGLAQALIHDPEVLILDEPTSGLDPNQLADIRNLIIELGKEKTVLLSTHIMQEVEAMCDRLLIINKGKIVTNKAIDQVKSSNKQSLVRFKVKGKDASHFNLEKVSFESTNDGFIIAKSNQLKNLEEQIFKYCVQQQYVLLHLAKEEGNLTDVFKQLTS